MKERAAQQLFVRVRREWRLMEGTDIHEGSQRNKGALSPLCGDKVLALHATSPDSALTPHMFP